MTNAYKEAGVDVEAGYDAVSKMQKHILRTHGESVKKGMANFGGLFHIPEQPGGTMLVAGADGVGTKLKVAFALDRHDTIGIDCVAMCVNDVVCHGAQPIFFLDYIATGSLRPDQIEEIVSGVAEGCVMAGCALLGGETAEMPGFYANNEYDLAGFAVGSVSPEKMIDGSSVCEGDALIGLASSGVHSNGFSLLRKLFMSDEANPSEISAQPDDLLSASLGDKADLSTQLDELNETSLGDGSDLSSLSAPLDKLRGASLGDTLLTPTKIYVKPVLALTREAEVHGIAHITGGGFFENIPRILPEGLCAEIELGSWDVPPIFDLAQERGEISERDMFGTFNMGIGMVVALPEDQAQMAIEILASHGEKATRIGRVAKGERGVVLCR